MDIAWVDAACTSYISGACTLQTRDIPPILGRRSRQWPRAVAQALNQHSINLYDTSLKDADLSREDAARDDGNFCFFYAE